LQESGGFLMAEEKSIQQELRWFRITVPHWWDTKYVYILAKDSMDAYAWYFLAGGKYKKDIRIIDFNSHDQVCRGTIFSGYRP
jgi:hypothetical protein